MFDTVEIRHFHLFCGLGGGARGFNRGEARLGRMRASFRCIGGIDVDAAAVADFGRLAGTPATMLDLFERDDYIAFHDREPPRDWRPAMPDDIRRAAGGEVPHILFLSAPCKGFSGLLPEGRSRSDKYQALNRLALRGLWLTLEAWKDNPPEFVLFENVPRIATRGRGLLDRITAILHSFGYAVAETTHDCGELGNLAQSRKRFLLVARHRAKVPPFLYEPSKHRLRAVGDVLEKLPLPGDLHGGPMHRVPRLHWRTWVRLAFVEAGSDWRSLQKLKVSDGVLEDFAIAPERPYHRGVFGVCDWAEPTGVVTGEALPFNGKFSVADPRFETAWGSQQFGTIRWRDHAPTITSQRSPGQGSYSIADPRIEQSGDYKQLGVRAWGRPIGAVSSQSTVGGGAYAIADSRLPHGPGGPHYNNVYRVVRWADVAPAVTAGTGPSAGGIAIADPRVGYGPDSHRNKLAIMGWADPARTVTGGSQVQGGALSVADPRPDNWQGGKYRVTAMDEPAGAVIGASATGNGAFAVADPRPAQDPGAREVYRTAGNYGVVPWSTPAGAVTAAGQHDNGHNSVADPRAATNSAERPARTEGLPAADARLVAVIRSMDGTWHRPFTTLELAALQSLVDPEEHLELEGLSDSAWRERIGNAVPPDAAKAIAGVMGRALLGAWAGESFALSMEPIWVRPIAIALQLARGGED